MDPRKCFNNHMGVWAIEPGYFQNTADRVRAGTMLVHKDPATNPACQGHIAQLPGSGAPMVEASDSTQAAERRPFVLTQDGIAVVGINGPMQKGFSKFGGTSTIALRSAIRAAVSDNAVAGIMLQIDSPGGTVAGQIELLVELANARAVKPLAAHLDDLGASAAYWAAVMADRITANMAAEAGSIGGFAVVWDQSKRFEEAGVAVHLLTTGELKGAGFPGTEVPKAYLDAVQTRVDDATAHFFKDVADRRKLSGDALKAVTDGNVHVAARALKLGLIDAVTTMDAAVAQFAARIQEERTRSVRARAATAALDLESEA